MDKARKSVKRPRRSFTPEFKAEAVRLCQLGDRTIAKVAGDLNLAATALLGLYDCATNMRQFARAKSRAPLNSPADLSSMANVGPATLGDFKMLGIQSSKQLAKREAFELWEDLCKRTGQRHDPCCIDVFMSAISQARGKSPCPWWHFTAQRKVMMAKMAAASRMKKS